MSLSTTQYGYIVDPMVPFTDDKGKTIKNGFIRVFMAGTSTPVLTYRNYDGATNQEKIELDNSGRVKHNVIGSKGSLYKVVVYNILHSQENPLLTVDKIAVLGASINASGATIVTGLDSVTVQEENFLKATVEGTGVELALDPTEVTSDVNTISAAETAAPDYVLPLLDKTGTGDGKKISLANLFKFALDWISRLATTVTSFASGDYIVVSNPTDGASKMATSKLMELTAQNALADNMAPAFDPTRDEEHAYSAGENVIKEGSHYIFGVTHYGAWNQEDVAQIDSDLMIAEINKSFSTLVNYSFVWERGNINDSTGADAGSANSIRVKTGVVVKSNLLIIYFNQLTLSTTTLSVYEYDAEGVFVKRVSAYASNGVRLIPWTSGHILRLKVASATEIVAVEDGDEHAKVHGREYADLTTDATLTKSGVPADAKSVGDALAVIDRQIDSVENALDDVDDVLNQDVEVPFIWERGNISNSTGADSGSQTAIRTKGSYAVNKSSFKYTFSLTNLDGCTLVLYEYTSAGVFVGRKTATSTPGTYDVSWTSGNKVRILLVPNAGITLDVSNGDKYARVFYNEYRNLETDKSLSIEGRAADAKTVGDSLAEIVPNYHASYHVVSVKTDGTGDFTTIRGAVDYIVNQGDANDENPYMIEVYPGTYDVLSDFTDEEIREANPSSWSTGFVGIRLTDGMNIRGVGERDTIILVGTLDADTYTSDIRNCISTLNLGGNGIVENITIKAENIRYCVHDSLGFYGPGRYSRVMRNVKMVAHNLTSSNADNPTCYGGTIRDPGGDYLFENCDFGGRFLKHGRDSVSSDTMFVVKNCRARKFLYAGANDGCHHQVLLDGCDFESIHIDDEAIAQSVFITANGLKDCCISWPADRPVVTGAILKAIANSLTEGTLVKHDGRGFAATTDKSIACGVVVGGDSDFCYIQVSGHLNSSVVGLSSLSVGDYITIDSNGKLTTTGATSANAVGVVDYIDPEETGVQFVKMLV